MNSITKLKLSDSQIREMISRGLGKEARIQSIKENTDGWFNALYEVELTDGRGVFLKAAPPDAVPILSYEKGIIKTEIALLKLFESHEAVPAPRILFTDESRSLAESEYFIMEKLEGRALSGLWESLDEAVLLELNRAKGAINRGINEIKGESFGLFGADFPKFSTWKEAFLFMVDSILEDARTFSAEFPISLEELEGIFRENADCLESVGEPSLVHWDLHDGNVIVGPDNRISGIIDCDRALWGDPALEYYFKEFFPEAGAFEEGYGKDIKGEPGFRERRFLYDLYLTTIFVTECQSRQIKDKGHLEWASSEFRKQLEKRDSF